MTPIEELMREWLESGTPEEQRHARARIAIGFGPVEMTPAEPVADLPDLPEIPEELLDDDVQDEEIEAPDEAPGGQVQTRPVVRRQVRRGCGCGAGRQNLEAAEKRRKIMLDHMKRRNATKRN